MYEGSTQHQAHSQSSHHVKMSLTIGATSSLVKRVALKGALAHSAHVVLHGAGARVVKHDETENTGRACMAEERKYKGRAGLYWDRGEN